MLKKLQNLLFEDEEDDVFEDDEEEEVEVPAKKPVAAAKPAVVAATPATPVQEKPVAAVKVDTTPVQQETRVTRIDVTAPIPTTTPVQPVTTAPVFPAEPVEEKKQSLGITVDDAYTAPAKTKTVKPAMQKAVKPASKKTKSVKPAYEFQPVISPIFGVNEKDMTALKNTTMKVAAAEAEDENVTPVISPIYGASEEKAPVERTSAAQPVHTPDFGMTYDRNDFGNTAPIDEIPDFSLDDILKVRDKEIERPVSQEDTAPIFPDLSFPEDPVETPVEENAPVDNTVVLNKEDLRKSK